MMIQALTIYFSIGMVIWLLLDFAGIVQHSDAERIAAGKPVSAPGIVIATVYTVLAWPWFVYFWVRSALS